MEDGMSKSALYDVAVADDKYYATYIGKNRAGKLILERKDNGKIVEVDKDLVSEVMPYTVSIAFTGEYNRSKSAEKHFEVEEGKLAVGDVILTQNGSFGIVNKLDTKSRNAKELKGARKVQTEKF